MDGHEAARQRREEWFREARRRLDERFADEGSPLATDADWRLVRALHEGDYGFLPCEEDDLAEIAYGLIVFYRRRAEAEGRDPLSATPITGATTNVVPPEWWVERSRERLEAALVERTMLRAAMGLWGPPEPDIRDYLTSALVPRDESWFQLVTFSHSAERKKGMDHSVPLPDIADIGPLLARLAQKQSHVGLRRTLRYLDTKPDGSALNPEVMARGNRALYVREMDVYAGPQPPATFVTSPRFHVLDDVLLARGISAEDLAQITKMPSQTFEFESWPTLEYLRQQSERFGALLGVDPGEVTAWFLCDYDLVAPWIDVHVAPTFGKETGTAAGLRLVLDVGSLHVTPEALARVYGHFRERMLAFYHQDSLPKPPDDWDVLHVRFITEWKAAHDPIDWKGAWAEWQSRYPDSKWKVFRSFRNAHYAGKGAKP